MGKPIIAIDIDDTIADSTEAYRVKINDSFGLNLQPEDYRKDHGSYWGYYEKVWQEHGVRELINADKLHEEMHYDQSHIPLLPGAEFAITELEKYFDIVLITARDIKWKAATEQWLKNQFSNKAPAVYFSEAHNKDDSKTKGQICLELGAEWLIDDNVQHCQTAVECGAGAILFGEYGWHNGQTAGLLRCKDWQAVLEYFENVRKS